MFGKIRNRDRDHVSAEPNDWKLDVWLTGSSSDGQLHIEVKWWYF